MSEVKQYPEWQKEFRAMQVIRDENHAKSQAKAQEEKAAQERETGEKLAKALMHFGIYVEIPPPANRIEIDGYIFVLAHQGNYSVYKNTDGKEWFDFTLLVAKTIPGRSADDEQNTEVYRRIEVNTRHNVQWDYYLCQLADVFDEIDNSLAYEIERDLGRQKRAAEREAAPPAESDSIDEKLLKLLRSIIRAEIANELYS